MSNPLNWWEIQVPDLDQAKAFYGGVFGWTFKAWMDGYEGVHLDDADGTMIGGLTRADRDVAGRGVHVCFSADRGDDTLEQLLDRVERHGGAITKQRTGIGGDMGWYATVTDPSGICFDLWTGRAATGGSS